jgi:hypothetical protein
MSNKMVEQELNRKAARYALNVEWKGDDYGARKLYYADAFKAGWRAHEEHCKEQYAKLMEAALPPALTQNESGALE